MIDLICLQLEQLESARLQELSYNATTIQIAWRRFVKEKRKNLDRAVCIIQSGKITTLLLIFL